MSAESASSRTDSRATSDRWMHLRLSCPACRAPLSGGSQSWDCLCGATYAVESGILRLTLGREGAPGYDPHFFRTLCNVEKRHFWFVSRRRVILDAIRRAVPDHSRRWLLDIGCGTGGLLAFLASEGISVSGGCDAYLESLRLVRGQLDVPLILVDEGRLPPLGAGQEMLSMFDVLEHVDDDIEVLRSLCRALVPGGFVILTVPAHPFLFDEMDKLAHHRRRYTKSQLHQRLVEAGFEVRLITHFMSPLVPLLALVRSLGRLLPQGAGKRRKGEFKVVPIVNALACGVLAIERRVLRFVSLPFGTSLVAVGMRRGSS